MSISRENISLWLHQSEPDYYLFFLKAWIPFNAWYILEYPSLKKKDSDIIKELQDDVNSKPRKIIENFLSNTKEYNALKFQSHLAELHFHLQNIPLSHNNNRLSFLNLSLTENPEKYKHYIDLQGNVFKTEKSSFYFQAYIEAKDGKVLLDYKKPTFDLFELTKDVDYLRLDDKVQKKIHSLFKDIDPRKPINLISKSTKKNDYILLKSKNSCKFINDKETVAKGCIKVLYALRCMLFHGELAPTNTNKPVYENAFNLLQLIIKEIN